MTSPREENVFTCEPCSVALELNVQKNQEVPDAPRPEQPGSMRMHFAVSAVRSRPGPLSLHSVLITSFILVKRIINVLWWEEQWGKLLRLAHERLRHRILSRTRNPLAKKENMKKKFCALFCCCPMFYFSQWQSFCISDSLIHSSKSFCDWDHAKITKLLSWITWELPLTPARQQAQADKQTRLGHSLGWYCSSTSRLREVKQTAQHRAVWELLPKWSCCSSLKSSVSCLNAVYQFLFTTTQDFMYCNIIWKQQRTARRKALILCLLIFLRCQVGASFYQVLLPIGQVFISC